MRYRNALPAILILLAVTAASTTAHTQALSVADGRKAIRDCLGCHSDIKGKNNYGPSLFGVVGRKSGSLPDYSYSPAMRATGWVWDEARLDSFIASPRQVVKGTYMPYGGMKDAVKRARVIAYLKTLHD